MLDVVKYESPSGEITFTAQEVKDRLCPNIDDKELALVMALCQAQKLNPFTKDVYIIKYGNSPASIVTSKEVFTKRAQEYIPPAPTEEEIAALREEVNQLAGQFGFMNGKEQHEAIDATLATQTVQAFGEVTEYEKATYEHLKAMRVLLNKWIEQKIEKDMKDGE